MKVNRNILWTELFFNELASLGVRHVCIAPGSRSTPLTYSAAVNDNFKSYVFIDERSCAFFALGLAVSTNTPVVLICTSGTAAAEFYPAVIEAYQQKVPLIICTADRSPELIDNGANQTIFQNGIYKNHVLWSYDTGLPELTKQRLQHIKNLGKRAVYESSRKNSGPVHLNFPFRKPLEPGIFTDDIDDQILKNFSVRDADDNLNINNYFPPQNENNLKSIISFIKQNKNGILIAGPDIPFRNYKKECIELAVKFKYPILADGASQFRNGNPEVQNILVNYDSYLRSDFFRDKANPDFIIQFGRTITSKGLESLIKNSTARHFIVNEFGQWYDPYNNIESVINLKPSDFCKYLVQNLDGYENSELNWLETFISAETLVKGIKENLIYSAEFPFEGRIINEVIQLLPEKSALMVSNSMPVRDLDYYAPKNEKQISIYSNRGASGIDGIVSTSLGISAAVSSPVVLITGDLAFYYDMNGLLASKKYSIPLVIILINNNGGGIFEMLPISGGNQKVFNDYFITPHNLDFSNFVKGYGGEFYNISDWNDFRIKFQLAINFQGLSVLQINTNAKESTNLRKYFLSRVESTINGR